MRTKLSKLIVSGALLGSMAFAGAALAQSSPADVACRVPSVVNVAVSEVLAETFVIPFAANSSELTPVAERVLEIAAMSYPEQPTLYLKIQGAEGEGQTETLVTMDRLTWVTAYLAQRDVPLQAMVFESPALAQMGCATSNEARL